MPTPTPDIASPEAYADGLPFAAYAELRARPGLAWHEYGDSGFWAVTRHADVDAVSRDIKRFSSGIGHTNLWDLEADALEARRSIIDSDPPDHRRLRKLVSKTFTPSAVGRWVDTTREIAGMLLDNFCDAGGGDWVNGVSAPLPIRVILSVLGVPIEDGEYLVELSNYLVEGTTDTVTLADDAFGNETPLRLLPFGSPASHAIFEYGEQLGATRLAGPQDDLITRLAELRGHDDGLSVNEFRNMFHVLIFAGNETTRTAMSHLAETFARQPERWRQLQADPTLFDNTVEEILRWSTPVLHMRRTAASDTELAGTQIRAGDKVVMWYAAANYDPDVFEDPHTFDVARPDKGQLSFGGGGPHFCLGAFLARMEIRVLLEEMLKRDIQLTLRSPAERVVSNFVNGLLRLDVNVTSAR